VAGEALAVALPEVAAAEVLTEVAPERRPPPLEVAEAQEASTGASLRDVMPEVEVSEEELLVAAAAEVVAASEEVINGKALMVPIPLSVTWKAMRQPTVATLEQHLVLALISASMLTFQSKLRCHAASLNYLKNVPQSPSLPDSTSARCLNAT